MDPFFSILIPTRARPDQFERLLLSLEEKTFRKHLVEIIVSIDYCDHENHERYLSLIGNYDDEFDIKTVIRSQLESLTEYYNDMARISSGMLIWVLNDDCEIVTNEWDSEVFDRIDHPMIHWPIYFDVWDSTRNFNNNGNFSCFPMVTRAGFNRLGFFFPPEIRTWGADKYLHKIYFDASRVIQLPNVFVKHHRECSDQNYEKMQRVFKEDNLANIENRVDFMAYSKKVMF